MEDCAANVVVTLEAALLDEAVALLEVQGRQAWGLEGLIQVRLAAAQMREVILLLLAHGNASSLREI